MTLDEAGRQPLHKGVWIVASVRVAAPLVALRLAGAKWRVDVDEVDTCIRQAALDIDAICRHKLIGRAKIGAELNRLLVEHSGRTPYHRPVLTDFVHWYPLADAAKHAPPSPGVFQVKVSGRLIDYPTGKSAMVCYGSAENLQEAVATVALEHLGAKFMCRHQGSDAPAVLLDFVLGQFVRRFGVPPTWPSAMSPGAPGPTDAGSNS